MRFRSIRFLGVLLTAAASLSACGIVDSGDCVEVGGELDPRAPGYIVMYDEGVPAQPTTDQLAERYDFTPTHIYTDIPTDGFAAELADAAVRGLRCESVVRSITHDGVATGD